MSCEVSRVDGYKTPCVLTCRYLGVADGVGSWIEVGVDPGLASKLDVLLCVAFFVFEREKTFELGSLFL